MASAFLLSWFSVCGGGGLPGIPTVENFEGCAVRLMNEKHSDFETDQEILNAVNRMTDRSIESNMMCSFTDCPQIEKLGWLETTQLMFSSMAAGYDIRSWIPKIMDDMQDAQVTEELLGEAPMKNDPESYPGFAFERFDNRETEEAGFCAGDSASISGLDVFLRIPTGAGPA